MEPFEIQPVSTDQIGDLFQFQIPTEISALPWANYAWIGFLVLVILVIIASGIITYHWASFEIEKLKHVAIQVIYYVGVGFFLATIGGILLSF